MPTTTGLVRFAIRTWGFNEGDTATVTRTDTASDRLVSTRSYNVSDVTLQPTSVLDAAIANGSVQVLQGTGFPINPSPVIDPWPTLDQDALRQLIGVDLADPLSVLRAGVSAVTEPDVRGLRFRGIPQAQPALATVTVTNNTSPASTLTGSVLAAPGVSYTSFAPDDAARFTPLGNGVVAGARGTGANGGPLDFCVGWKPTRGTQRMAIEFLHDGAQFEVGMRQFGGNAFRVLVDGVPLQQYPVQLGGTSGSFGNVKVVFPSRAARHITFEVAAEGPWFLGIWVNSNDSVRAVRAPARRLVVAGDSFADGSAVSALSCFPWYLARQLGFRDFVNAGVGGTGWLAPGTQVKLRDRLTNDVLRHLPTDVVIALGRNDAAYTAAELQAEAALVIAQVKDALPTLRSFTIVGPWWTGSAPGAFATVSAGMKAAADAAGVRFLDTITNPLFTGTGRVGATTGTGNSDLYVASDNVHPTDPGSAWLGTWAAHEIALPVR